MKKILYCFSITFLLFGCQPKDGIRLTKGLILSKSVVVSNQIFKINGDKPTDEPVLIIKGSNIEIDFNGATLQGSNDKNAPEDFYGLGILIENGKNITLKNLNVHGYKIGLKGLDVEGLTLENCDFSYNYRQKLHSSEMTDNFKNQKDSDWLEFGAGVYLDNCPNATVKNTTISEGQNGVMLANCNNGLFYNNKIQFNSGFGITLLNSNENRILNNKLDWNVRNYWDDDSIFGVWSGGIAIKGVSAKNKVAYNSVTHCGTGISVNSKWLSRQGEATSDNNVIYGNDCSYAVHSGVELCCDKNKVIGNIMIGCTFGVQNQFTFDNLIAGNVMEDCKTGIFITDATNTKVRQNEIISCLIGISNLNTSKYKNDDQTRSRIAIDHNLFKNCSEEAISIANSPMTNVVLNQFVDCPLTIDADAQSKIIEQQNEINPFEEKEIDNTDFIVFAPSSLPDAINTNLSGGLPQGRNNILINEYGPYSFRYPKLWLRTQKDGEYVFALFGPYGNWKLKNAEGLERISLKTGTTPATIVANKSKDGKPIKIELEFIGEAIETQFGEKFEKGTPFQFGWKE